MRSINHFAGLTDLAGEPFWSVYRFTPGAVYPLDFHGERPLFKGSSEILLYPSDSGRNLAHSLPFSNQLSVFFTVERKVCTNRCLSTRPINAIHAARFNVACFVASYLDFAEKEGAILCLPCVIRWGGKLLIINELPRRLIASEWKLQPESYDQKRFPSIFFHFQIQSRTLYGIIKVIMWHR